MPVSSETTTTAASVSSDSPRAARWRVPRFAPGSRFLDSGRKQPAAEMRLPWMIDRPVVERGAGLEHAAEELRRHDWHRWGPPAPRSGAGRRPLETISAPRPLGRERLRRAHDLLDHVTAPGGARAQEGPGGAARPAWASVRLSSGWKRTISARTQNAQKFSRMKAHAVEIGLRGPRTRRQEEAEPREHLDRERPP